jgi:hypothetical protein
LQLVINHKRSTHYSIHDVTLFQTEQSDTERRKPTDSLRKGKILTSNTPELRSWGFRTAGLAWLDLILFQCNRDKERFRTKQRTVHVNRLRFFHKCSWNFRDTHVELISIKSWPAPKQLMSCQAAWTSQDHYLRSWP